jgi:hypothetical protein
MWATKIHDQFWKHITAAFYQGVDNYAGIDLYDDEEDGHVSIYVRFKDGTRWPARTVSLKDAAQARQIITAWAERRGPLNDYRRNKTLKLA